MGSKVGGLGCQLKYLTWGTQPLLTDKCLLGIWQYATGRLGGNATADPNVNCKAERSRWGSGRAPTQDTTTFCNQQSAVW